MAEVTGRRRLQFALRDLAWFITGLSVWLAIIHYGGWYGVIFSSPIVGGILLVIGALFKIPSVTVIGAAIFLVGPFVLGIASAVLTS